MPPTTMYSSRRTRKSTRLASKKSVNYRDDSPSSSNSSRRSDDSYKTASPSPKKPSLKTLPPNSPSSEEKADKIRQVHQVIERHISKRDTITLRATSKKIHESVPSPKVSSPEKRAYVEERLQKKAATLREPFMKKLRTLIMCAKFFHERFT